MFRLVLLDILHPPVFVQLVRVDVIFAAAFRNAPHVRLAFIFFKTAAISVAQQDIILIVLEPVQLAHPPVHRAAAQVHAQLAHQGTF